MPYERHVTMMSQLRLIQRRAWRVLIDARLPFGHRTCPKNLIYFLTERCNYQCPHCFVHHEGRAPRKELAASQVIEILRSAQPHLFSITFTGGEPLLFNDFEAVFRFASFMKGLKYLAISTNGFMYENLLYMIRKYANSHMGYLIQLSCDGPETIHNSIRGSNQAFTCLTRLIAGIQEIQCRGLLHVDLNVVMTVSRMNQAYVGAVCEWAQKQKIPLLLNFVRSSAEARLVPDQISDFKPRECAPLSPDEMRQATDIWLASMGKVMEPGALLLHKVRMRTVLEFKQTGRWPYLCAAGMNDAVIYPDGSVSICETRNPIGNIADACYDYVQFWKNHPETVLRDCFCAYDCAMLYSITKSWQGYKAIIKKAMENVLTSRLR